MKVGFDCWILFFVVFIFCFFYLIDMYWVWERLGVGWIVIVFFVCFLFVFSLLDCLDYKFVRKGKRFWVVLIIFIGLNFEVLFCVRYGFVYGRIVSSLCCFFVLSLFVDFLKMVGCCLWVVEYMLLYFNYYGIFLFVWLMIVLLC